DVLPVITEHPLDVIVAKGEPAALNCAAKGPDVQISWYKDGQRVITNKDETSSHRLILQTGALFLLRVNNGKSGKDADSGTYYCVAKNKYGEARSREASLKIAMLRDDFRTRPRTTQAVIGNRAVMECVPPKGFPEPVVSWRKNDREFRPEDDERITILPSGNLIIDKVQRSDAGLYQCVATNMVGEKVSSPARLSVYEKPYFQQEPRDVTADVGTSVLFDCRVSGDPMPSITWKKRNQQMPVGRAYIAPDNRGLRIDRVEPSDEGEYLCQAKNPAGSIETSARLRVHAAPSFVKTPSDVSIESGGTAMFECEAEGQPLPASFWSREGQQDLLFPGHTSLDGRVKVSLDGKLTIKDVRPADEGNYVCAAMNAAGSSLTKAALKVDSKTRPSNPPPIIEHGHSNQTLTVSVSATLPCQASGRTPPRISWLKNGEPIDVNEPALESRFIQLATGSLRISDLRKSDTGVYTCRARNEDGESTWTASLIVEEHTNPLVTFSRMPDISTFPTAPGTPVVFNVTEDGVDLEWTPPEKNGATLVTGYILQYFSPELGETWFNVADYIPKSRFRVRDLKPSHSYVFIVRAENSHGIGPPSGMSEMIRTKAAKNEFGQDAASANLDLDLARQRIASEQLLKLDEVKTINATAVQLTWKRRRIEPLVQGYYIKWRAVPGAVTSGSDSSWVNVSKANIDSYVIGGLRPFTNYEFFVIPYHKSVQGMPSNSLDGTTDESAPTSAPSDVRVRMMNLTTLRISWRPPPAGGINGVLKGFQIVILGSGAKYNRNITTNERAASVTLFHLVPSMTYSIKVAAKSNAGVGVFTEVQRVTMDEETLEEHNRIMSGMGSSSERILYVIKRPWFIAVAGVLMWMVFVALIALIWWRWKRSKGKAAARLGMPFIKINDGSVHLTARDALWMDHTNFNSAQRTLLLNNSLNAAACNGPPLYTQTPHQTDFYIDAHPHNEYAGNLMSTMDRSQSPHHYQYAALASAPSSAMSTFCAGQQDDPSPYATTTLVMSNRQKWLKEHMLRGPVLPSNPVPSGPPPRFQDIASSQTINGRRSASARCSSNGRSKAGTLNGGRRSPPKQTLLDFMPPPPPGAPPPEDVPNAYLNGSVEPISNRIVDASDHYDAVSDSLLRRDSRYSPRTQPTDTNRPDSRSRNEADEENSDDDERSAPCERDATHTPEYASHRPSQPCMGVSASTLSQSSYDANSSKRSAARLKTIPRGSKKDLV
uniref:Roundabout n=1 Tax=Parascaris univalens TaxID=6257 RepID=A0A915AF13_PARUN